VYYFFEKGREKVGWVGFLEKRSGRVEKGRVTLPKRYGPGSPVFKLNWGVTTLSKDVFINTIK
jgi:hypothetical protein